jgi:hypothetical protein
MYSISAAPIEDLSVVFMSNHHRLDTGITSQVIVIHIDLCVNEKFFLCAFYLKDRVILADSTSYFEIGAWPVIPAQAGIQFSPQVLGPGFRRGDDMNSCGLP